MPELLPEPYGTKPLTSTPIVVKEEDAALKTYPELYAAGSEPLADDEMRITALGTGYPARRGQGCAGFMAELGNGEVFIFDVGAGTNAAFNHMAVPYHKANKFFITHYHIDHIADLLVYYDFGQSNGRLEPMNVYRAPPVTLPELGHRRAGAEHCCKHGSVARPHERRGTLTLADSRSCARMSSSFERDAGHLRGERAQASPRSRFRTGSMGPLDTALDWNGLSMVFAGDCEPSTLTDRELPEAWTCSIHEVFNTPDTYVDKMGWTEQMAKIVAWTKHTSPQAAAKVFEAAKPGLGVGYHSMVAPGTPQPILDGIRTGYDGPVLVSQDFTVINVTPQQIVSRMAAFEPGPFLVSDPEYLASKGGAQQDASVMHGLPEWLEATIIEVPEIEAFKQELAAKGMR